MQSGHEHGYPFHIIAATEQVNVEQKMKVIKKLMLHLPNLTGKKIAVRWLAFKPKTDDVRDAPSLVVCRALLDAGVKNIQCFDPEGIWFHKKLFGVDDRISYTDRWYDALEGVDALLLLTEWDAFRNPDFDKVKERMSGNIIIDGRNIRHMKTLEEKWFIYECIGKGK